jgi:hypothetical protein
MASLKMYGALFGENMRLMYAALRRDVVDAVAHFEQALRAFAP